MTIYEKALANLKGVGISAFEKNDRIYLDINQTPIEISLHEIAIQASEYDRKELKRLDELK